MSNSGGNSDSKHGPPLQEELAEIVKSRENTLLVVDAITALGVFDGRGLAQRDHAPLGGRIRRLECFAPQPRYRGDIHDRASSGGLDQR